jgi:hypothetical protein
MREMRVDFAGVGVADEADVGEELELEAVGALFAGAAEFVLARGLVGGGGEVLVAAAAAPAAAMTMRSSGGRSRG